MPRNGGVSFIRTSSPRAETGHGRRIRDFLCVRYGHRRSGFAFIFGYLVGTGSLWSLAGGYVFAALLMLGAALTEYKYGVDAEMRSLESIAEPLSSE